MPSWRILRVKIEKFTDTHTHTHTHTDRQDLVWISPHRKVFPDFDLGIQKEGEGEERKRAQNKSSDPWRCRKGLQQLNRRLASLGFTTNMARFAVGLVIGKYDHSASSRRVITTFKPSSTLADVVSDFHPYIGKGYSIRYLESSDC